MGRRQELESVGRLLRDHRLVSIVGAGGIGKTRLAQAVVAESGRRFPDGIWVVELTDVTRPELLAPALLEAVGGAADPALDLLPAVAARLGHRQGLLVLDECEHLVPVLAPVIEQLLHECPRLTVLATSQEPLGLPAEQRWTLQPLEVPAPGETLANHLVGIDSVALFRERARRVRPDWELTSEVAPAVAEIVRRLDGIPLAIELAAAWMSTLAPADLLARLDRRFEVLVNRERAPRRRHASLLAAIDSTYRALDADTRSLFRRLGVFPGAWTLDSMIAVCQLSEADALAGLATLVERSLVLAPSLGSGSARYEMLETVREFARDQLREAGEEGAARERLAGFVTGLVHRGVAPELLDLEQSSIRAILDQPPSAGVLVALTAELIDYWELRGRFAESRLRLTRAAELASEPSPQLARILAQLGFVLFVQGDPAGAVAALRRALAAARAAGHDQGAVTARNHLSLVSLASRKLGPARWWARRALATVPRGDPALLAQCHLRMGEVERSAGNLAAARDELKRAVAAGGSAGRSPDALIARINLARIDISEQHWDDAESGLRRLLDPRPAELTPRALAGVMEALAAVAAGRGERSRAARLAGIAAGIIERAELIGPVTSYAAALETAIAGPGGDREYRVGRRMDIEAGLRFALGEEAEPAPAPRRKTVRPAAPLSKRQLGVARLVARGLTNKEIAQELWISERTAEGHVEQIRNKLGVSTRVQVAAWYLANYPDP